MRLPNATPPEPTHFKFDVLFTQHLGLPATGATVRAQPTGGSEWQLVLLAEALAASGYKVGVISPVPSFVLNNGVNYIPLAEVIGRRDAHEVHRPSAKVSADVLVSERFGQLVPGVEFTRVVFDLHDLPDNKLQHVISLMHEIPDSQVVVHSDFARSLLDGWPRVSVIPCMLPDEFYAQPAPVVVKAHERVRSYVYGSAAVKGLEPTMALWNELKRSKNYHFRKATLTICSPGYDSIDPKLLEGAKDVRVYQGLSPAGMQTLLAASDGIFMVSSFPETFGIVFHQCEIAGKPAHVLQTHGVEDALATTLEYTETLYTEAGPFVASFEHTHEELMAKDFRISTHLDKWIDVLGLNKQQEQAA